MTELNIFYILIFFIILSFISQVLLDKIQIKYLINNINHIPEAFRERISPENHQKSVKYSVEKLEHRVKRNITEIVFLGILTYGGFLDLIATYFYNISMDLSIGGALTGSLMVLFFYGVVLIVDLPFNVYKQFVIEERYGFNRMTLKLWLTDLLKSSFLSIILMFPIIYCILSLMVHRAEFGDMWWIFLWGFVVTVSIFFMILFPVFIAPIFNKFSPLPNGKLKERLENLLFRCKFESKGLFTMDGSKRSAHGHAYFSGIGSAKRIVLFDTLIDKLNEEEIEAVLAHEVGHYKCGHVPYRLLLSALLSFGFFYFLALFIDSTLFFLSFGIMPETLNFYDGSEILAASFFILFFYVLPNALFPLKPLTSILSRKHEFEADDYAARNAEAEHLISALMKLYKENSAPVITNKWFSLFYDSHPNAMARIDALK